MATPRVSGANTTTEPDVPDPQPPCRRLGWLLAFALAGCSTSAPSPAGSLAPSATATAAPTAVAPTPSPVPAQWAGTNLPFQDVATTCAPVGGTLANARVVEFGSGLLALGTCGHSAGASLVWVSTDGRSWRASAPAALAHADVYALIVADGLIIAGGQDVSNGAAAAAWTSRDGLTWTRSDDIGCGVMLTVTRFGSGFVAFGNRVPNIPELEVPPGVCEWVSADGLFWTSVSLPKAVFPASTAVSSVAAGPGGLVAVGTDSGPQRTVAALWRSSDGRAWTRGVVAGTADWFSFDMAFAGGPDFVVLGSDSHGTAALATSPDGLSWTLSSDPVPGAMSGLPGEGPWFDAGPTGLIFGAGFANNAQPPGTIWLSTDGRSWRPTPALPPGLSLDSVAAGTSTFLFVASTADGHPVIGRLQP
jgi:hypothetical protein